MKFDTLNTYRVIMIGVHVVFTMWILNIWGFQLKTFLFLTKINFFLNFFYFFYTGLIVIYILKEKYDEKLTNSIFKFSFCLSVAVLILYWTIVFCAPQLMGNAPTPLALDLFLHGGNMFVLLGDCYLSGKDSYKENHISRNFLILFTVSYFLMQYFVYYTLEIEIYPMVSKLSPPLFAMVGVTGFGLFSIGDFFFDRILAPKLLNRHSS